jgi:lysophospholipase L1-like esterase
LLELPRRPARRIEFIGNSITCGTGSDLSETPCDSGQWYDQHNAYQSYGPQTARNLDADWHLSAVSGIGLIRSCCEMDITMPRVFDKINMRDNSGEWDFSGFHPDVVTIALGQNDGKQDSVAFSEAYVAFVAEVRALYPGAAIVCLSSPMADEGLNAVLQNYLTGVVNRANESGDERVYKYFFSKRYNRGCGDHPDLQQHGEIARELTAYIKSIMRW